MKKNLSITLAVSFLFISQILAQDYYSYQNGKKVVYQISDEELIVQYNSKTVQEQWESILKNNVPPLEVKRSSVPGLSFVKLKNKSLQDVNDLLSSMKADRDLVYSSPVLLNETGLRLGGITDHFIVKLKSEGDLQQLENLAAQYNAKIVRQYAYDDRTFILSTSITGKNAMELANIFHESGKFEWSEPDFLTFVYKTTSDPYYSQQWHLNSTGQHDGAPDSDIDAPEAWAITAGCSSIRVAVIDDGVDLYHRDLQANLLPGYDATGRGTGGAPYLASEAHGTHCAGVIAAVANNNIGIAGVAYNCKIVPISASADLVSRTENLAEGIDWAKHNAEVISIAWNVYADQSLITDAVNRAYTEGRSGKGCVLLAATGNNDASSINFPSSLSNIIAVGATNTCDRRKTKSTSCGGETDWGSNYGTGLDVVAPGVKIYSTDISGSGGKNSTDYHPTFNGTTAAVSTASGIAALILSVNPNLTATQAREVLERSTDKRPNYSFTNVSGQPNGTWNIEMGYGRVNAYNALYSMFNISGPDVICSNNTTYAIQSNIPYSTVGWSAYNVTPTSGSGLTATVSPNGLGSGGWIEWTFVTSTCTNPIKVRKQLYVSDYIEGTYTNNGRTSAIYTTNSVSAGTTSVKLSYPGINSYSWVKTSGSPTYYSIFDSGKQATIELASGQSVSFRITATGPCGTIVSREITFYVSGWSSYSITPNPTSGMLTVKALSGSSVENDSDQEIYLDDALNERRNSILVKLYNKTQKLVASGRLQDGSVRLNVENLPSDVYYLHIIDGKEITFKHILINH